MHFLKKFGAEIVRLVIFAAVLGAVGASGAVWQWSATPGTNSNVDPHINWSVGMAPSAVGASSRAEMAELAKWRDDISGLITTGGISTAYTATTNQGLCVAPSSTTTPIDGQLLSVTVNSTNGISPTLQADSCNAFPIQSSAGVAVAAASLISGSPYTLRFSVANSAWMLRDFYSSSALNVPLGGLLHSTVSTPPNSNFIVPAGQCISTTTYAVYWVAIGSPASGSCAGGQFAVIDMRGRGAVALDTLPGFSAANRLTSAANGCGTAMTTMGATCANSGESNTLITANLPPYTPSGTGVITGQLQQGGAAFGAGGVAYISPAGSGNTPISPTVTITMNAQGGTSTAFPRVAPVIGLYVYIRVI